MEGMGLNDDREDKQFYVSSLRPTSSEFPPSSSSSHFLLFRQVWDTVNVKKEVKSYFSREHS